VAGLTDDERLRVLLLWSAEPRERRPRSLASSTQMEIDSRTHAGNMHLLYACRNRLPPGANQRTAFGVFVRAHAFFGPTTY